MRYLLEVQAKLVVEPGEMERYSAIPESVLEPFSQGASQLRPQPFHERPGNRKHGRTIGISQAHLAERFNETHGAGSLMQSAHLVGHAETTISCETPQTAPVLGILPGLERLEPLGLIRTEFERHAKHTPFMLNIVEVPNLLGKCSPLETGAPGEIAFPPGAAVDRDFTQLTTFNTGRQIETPVPSH
jgi:hypothetical protein